jgi:hypothetical protein
MPNDPALLSNLAWLLASSADDSIRNGTEAVELAGRAVELTASRDPNVLAVSAGAYAEARQFRQAISRAEQARDLAILQNKRELADQLTDRLKLYRAGSPYHERPSP